MALRPNQDHGQHANFVFDDAKRATTMTLRQAGYATDEERIAAGDDAGKAAGLAVSACAPCASDGATHRARDPETARC